MSIRARLADGVRPRTGGDHRGTGRADRLTPRRRARPAAPPRRAWRWPRSRRTDGPANDPRGVWCPDLVNHVRTARGWYGIAGVNTELRCPAVGELRDVVRVLREWQHT